MAGRRAPKKLPPGNPSQYQAHMAEQGYKLCLLGATFAELADFLGVSERTVNRWMGDHPKFAEAVRKGKAAADATVAHKLYRRALGYSHPDSHISAHEGQITVTPITKHYPPDTTACIFWLKNRRSGQWRDRHELTGKDGEALSVTFNFGRAKVTGG